MTFTIASSSAQSWPGRTARWVSALSADSVRTGSTTTIRAPPRCRSSARRQPPGADSSQFQALTAGFAPTSRKKSQSSISETGTISGDPYIAWATTCTAFWSTEPTAYRLCVPIASSQPFMKIRFDDEYPAGFP